ncbi:hypothetical protein IC762_18080 [Bradyrhizobium genosp. L]|uniref:DUF6894 family protein n=1 Tax=Bradyrhizobium genosp. L TaxID=83637 RepID=UPI0018A2E34A|nr:hypothetical protein [Bradyrhizobium genosp. L]QPF81729.1 hypothetical protein IC762_18080 [Bradyrhizobium genosp. L]
MSRYYFDIQSNGEFYADEEGLDLSDLKAAEIEALTTLAGMAKDSTFVSGRPDMAIEVRSTTKRLFCVSLIYRDVGARH